MPEPVSAAASQLGSPIGVDSPPGAADPGPPRLRGGKPLALVTLLTLLVHAAVITDGFRLSPLEPDGPSQYFDAYASSLIEGRLDVDPYHIGNEAFVIDDHTYGYWGLTPALPRILLNALFPTLWGHWTRLAMLLSVVIALAATHALVRGLCTRHGRASKAVDGLHVLLLLSVGLGSSALFLPSRANVYHEATALAAALALASYASLASYTRMPSRSGLVWVGVLCALALHARVVAGLGVLLAMGVSAVWLLRARLTRDEGSLSAQRATTDAGPRASGVGLALAAALVFFSYLLINWLKFGTLLSLPIDKNLQSSPERLARTGGRMLGLDNFAANAFNHLAPWNVRIGPGPRPIGPVAPDALWTTSGMDYDWREPIVSVVAASPALVVLAGSGIVVLVLAWRREPMIRQLFPLILGAGASALVPLLYFAITQRYAHDMLPLLVVLSSVAVAHAQRLPRLQTRRSLAGLSVLLAWSSLCWWQVGEGYRVWADDTRISPVRADVVIPAYERELRLHPENLTALSELAGIHLALGRTRQAREYARKALTARADHLPSLLLLATLDARESPAKALRLLRRAAEKAPEEPIVHAMLGQALLRSGHTADAIEHLQQAARLSPEDPMPRALLEQALASGRAAP